MLLKIIKYKNKILILKNLVLDMVQKKQLIYMEIKSNSNPS